MTVYRFTSDHPLIFSDHTVGEHIVVRANPDPAGEAPDGSTLVLYPGDTIDLPGDAPSPWLIEDEPAPSTPNANKSKPKTADAPQTVEPAPDGTTSPDGAERAATPDAAPDSTETQAPTPAGTTGDTATTQKDQK